jgi:hypothetical protein
MSNHLDEYLHQKTPRFKGYLQDMVVHHVVAVVRDILGVHRDGMMFPLIFIFISFNSRLF